MVLKITTPTFYNFREKETRTFIEWKTYGKLKKRHNPGKPLAGY